MAVYNISRHGVIVLLNRVYYDRPRYKSPIDVEGTVLTIVDQSRASLNMLKQGRFIELICDGQWNDSTSIHIRWENDQKEWYAGGTMVLRRAKMSFCSSIWTSDTKVKVDTRPYHELKSNYYQRPRLVNTKRASLFSYSPKIHKAYNHITHIPYDTMWHKCTHEGVLSWARKVAGGFEFKEDTDNTTLHFITELEADTEEVIKPPTFPSLVQGGTLHKGIALHEGITTYINTTIDKVTPPTEYKWTEDMSNVVIKGNTLASFEDLLDERGGNTTPKPILSNEEIDDEIDDGF